LVLTKKKIKKSLVITKVYLSLNHINNLKFREMKTSEKFLQVQSFITHSNIPENEKLQILDKMTELACVIKGIDEEGKMKVELELTKEELEDFQSFTRWSIRKRERVLKEEKWSPNLAEIERSVIDNAKEVLSQLK